MQITFVRVEYRLLNQYFGANRNQRHNPVSLPRHHLDAFSAPVQPLDEASLDRASTPLFDAPDCSSLVIASTSDIQIMRGKEART